MSIERFPVPEPTAKEAAATANAVLAWYDRHRRRLPWRALPGEVPDPYRVWLSEIMLQQTTVLAVETFFAAFLERWPTVEALAGAQLDDVLTAWAGLGYYARARNLHACAKAVVDRHGGRFPADEDGLRALPGIGEYTAAAVAAIAYDRPTAVMDGNIERVIARLFAVDEPLPGAKKRLRSLVAQVTPQSRAGDFAQAMMDIGSGVCTPRRPRCMACPLAKGCRARAAGIAEELPVKAEKKARPVRRAVAFFGLDGQGRVLLRRRPERGLLGGMMEVPSSPWVTQPMPSLAAVTPPVPADWRLLPGFVRHGFTHFVLELSVAAGHVAAVGDGRLVPLDALGDVALPTVMRKIVDHAVQALDGQAPRSR